MERECPAMYDETFS